MLGFNDLTIKTQALILTFLIGIFSVNAFAQEVEVELSNGGKTTITSEQLSEISENLEVESEKHEGKFKRTLRKISLGFKKKAQKLKKKKKSKRKVTLRRVLLGAGKGATFVSVQTARPFVNIAGFLKGFFERPGKNSLEVEYMKIFLNHESKFSDIWTTFNPRMNPEELVKIQVAFEQRVELIIQEKQEIITKDIMANLESFADPDESIMKENIAKFVNQHIAYQELLPVLGEISAESVDNFEEINLVNDPMQILGAARITAVEGIAGFAMKTILPKMVVGLISKSIGSAVLAVGLIADAGMITSALMCTMNKKTMAKIDAGDDELRNFCQYVVNKSAYTISKSRMKGYVSGKKLRRKFIKRSERMRLKVQRKLKKKKANLEENKA